MEFRDLIGVRFKIHGRGREEGFDCYGLAVEVLRREGTELPDVLYDSLYDSSATGNRIKASDRFVRIERPERNCLVEISCNGEAGHVAVFIGGGRIIHALKKAGVVVEPLARYSRRICGFYRVRNKK